jgi:hypothetical protein
LINAAPGISTAHVAGDENQPFRLSKRVRFARDCGHSACAPLRQLWADCVEKVENAASAEFAQKRIDRQLRLAREARSLNESAQVEAAPTSQNVNRTSGS